MRRGVASQLSHNLKLASRYRPGQVIDISMVAKSAQCTVHRWEGISNDDVGEVATVTLVSH
jgi:hypothetical protein